MAENVICIPTYGHSERIKKHLDTALAIYIHHGFDIYIYDSSEDDSVERVISEYKEYMQNLFFVKMPSTMPSNVKVYRIYQGYGLLKKYRYIWLGRDRSAFSESLLNEIQKYIDCDYDIITTYVVDIDQRQICLYNNQQQMFNECSWILSGYGNTILRVSTFLENINWDYYENKYLIGDRLAFSHLGLYFERMLDISSFKGVYINAGRQGIVAVSGETSKWFSDSLRVFLVEYPSVIEALPDCYQNKKQKGYELAMRNGFLSAHKLFVLRSTGNYTINDYCKYGKKLRECMNLSIWSSAFIALLPEVFAKFVFIMGKKDLLRFCRHYKEIYIYGGGTYALRYADFLEKNNISFIAFVVSDTNINLNVIMNHKVVGISNIDIENSNIGIVLALNDHNKTEVISEMGKIQAGVFSRDVL